MTGHTAVSHKRIRKLQSANKDEYHHPLEKVKQLKKFENLLKNKSILEVFAGQGNLTKYYKSVCNSVISMTKESYGNSFDSIYKFKVDKRKFDIIDIDSYGYPDKFFPIVFDLLKDNGVLIFTFPIVGVNCLNGITEQHFINYWKSSRPTVGDVVGCITDLGLRNWQLSRLINITKIKRIWRFIFFVEKQKATNFCNTKNHK